MGTAGVMTCPKCGKAMYGGAAMDFHGGSHPVYWVGLVEKTTFLGRTLSKLDLKNIMPLAGCRCVFCGYVEFYAKPPQ
jgi:predicted nucleic-acid-binding Zn-ribbon protein